MRRTRTVMNCAVGALLMVMLPASAQDQEVNWSTVDSGGEIAASGDPWQLSGTFGQWDATDSAASSAGAWELTGGFWSLNTDSDFLFKDGYES